MADSAVTLQTYRYERWRAVANGILETGGTTFLLLIAVKHFEAGATAKAFVAGGGSIGLVLTPLVVSWVQRTGWRAALQTSAATSFSSASKRRKSWRSRALRRRRC